MKGIVLAGGLGTRLYPITKYLSKQSLPVYDKPMIYYPISTLALAGVREVLVISTPQHLSFYREILGDGTNFGMEFQFCEQVAPKGIAEAFILGADFIKESACALILGDNLFHGPAFGAELLKQMANLDVGAKIFAYQVSNPESYGVIEIDEEGEIRNLVEKPAIHLSNLAIPGLYFFDNQVVGFAHSVKPSSRGELEILSILERYHQNNQLKYEILSRGNAWLDTGTFEGLHGASEYVRIIEQRQGQKIGCIEEIAWRNKWISNQQLLQNAAQYKNSSYGTYLESLVNQNYSQG
jgi:glucose-1-phosphate thymidylyltransferase